MKREEIKEKVMILGDRILNLLFPPKCPLCEEVISEVGFCRECRGKIRFLKDRGRVRREHLAEGRVLLEYSGVAPAIYRFKYSGRREYAKIFAAEICREFGELVKEWNADAIIGVPLHPKRQKKRGYNQAQLLAKELSKLLKVPFYKQLVVRVKNTVPLKELNSLERQNNLKKAFKLYRNDVKLYTVIIVDDIYTTGQTVEEMAKVLQGAGVRQIYALAVAGGMEN